MNKIGILTFHSSDNYGALLQTYGTYHVLEKRGYKPVIINYHSPNKEQFYRLGFSKKLSLKENVKKIINFPSSLKKRKKADSYRWDILKIDRNKMSTKEELTVFASQLDKVIVGSDQVWNYLNTKFDERYFLDFVEGEKRIAYAASFSVTTIQEDLKQHYIAHLSGFPSISIREDSGVMLVKALTGQNVPQVLDPTFLLSGDEWRNHAAGSEDYTQFGDYLVCYFGTKEVVKQARVIAKAKGLKVVVIQENFMSYFEGEKVVVPSIKGFIKIIDQAAYVVTNSFHGTAFAINLGKPFSTVLNSKNPRNSRQLSLLKKLGINNRALFDGEINDTITQPIDYDKVNSILSELRVDSLHFLEQALKE